MGGGKRCERYIKAVLRKNSNYPETIKLAAQRFVDDLHRKDIYFDLEAADTAIGNIEMMPHTKGRWQGQNTVLQDFQYFWVANLFGWKWANTGLRRFRYDYL